MSTMEVGHFFIRTTLKEREWILQHPPIKSRDSATTKKPARPKTAPHTAQHQMTSGQKRGGVVDEGNCSGG